MQHLHRTKQKEEEIQRDTANTAWMLKKAEEERIKRLFGVSELS